jgi:hypothetical protein
MQVGVVKTTNYVVSLSLSGCLNWWKVENITEATVAEPELITQGHRKKVIKAWYSEGSVVSIDSEGTVLKLASINEVAQKINLGKTMTSAAFSPSGEIAMATTGKDVILINCSDLSEAGRVAADGFINKIVAVSETKFLVATNKNTVTVFNEGAVEFSIKLPQECIAIDISADGNTIFAGSNVTKFLIIRETNFTKSTWLRTRLSTKRFCQPR